MIGSASMSITYLEFHFSDFQFQEDMRNKKFVDKKWILIRVLMWDYFSMNLKQK